MQPPTFGGALGDRSRAVLTMSGLGSFEESRRAPLPAIDGVPVRVLPLDRIVASKRAANRPKDSAALPALDAALVAIEDEQGR